VKALKAAKKALKEKTHSVGDQEQPKMKDPLKKRTRKRKAKGMPGEGASSHQSLVVSE